tara:strand:- start:76 stop:1617 length:1542 start_codon:yes stop_codon:yes gene_type:complete
MARLNIDVGIEGNSATGDTLRTAMNKINDNFIEVFDDLSASGLGGRLTNNTTNGDVVIQPNGTGIVEVDQLQITDDAITSLITNGDLTLSGNGTGGVKVSGVLNVDDGINITDNVISSSASNANLELTASGTGEVTTDTAFKLISDTPFLKIQRLDNANVPGIDFIGAAGTSGSKILFDGTSGSANELIFQTFTVAGGLAEAFRVQGGGAKVTGSLDVDGGITITDNTITTAASNANLELTAAGTGKVKVVGILTVDDGSVTDNYVGIGNDDDLKIFHNGSHSIIRETGTGNLFLQSDNNVILGKDSSSETMVKGIADGAVELYHDNTKKFETTSGGVSVVGAVTSTGATDLTLNTNAGTDSGSIVLKDGTNGDIVLTTDGSGDILLQPGGKVGIGSVNQPDSLLHLKDTNSVITLQRTNDANTPGLAFQNSGGNTRATIKMDGTGGTSKELVFQTQDGSLAEKFRVTLSGAKVTGNLEVTGAQVDFTSLPTSDPGVAGRLFRSGNDVKISTG